MIIYQTESWADVGGIIANLAASHYLECKTKSVNYEFSLDLETFSLLADTDSLHVFTARDDGELIGYIVNAVSDRHLNYDAKTANHLGWYVAPEYRKKLVGFMLLSKSENELKKMGVQIMYGSHTVETNAAPAFQRLGWNEVETHYVKVIG